MSKTLSEAGINNNKLFLYGNLVGRNELMTAPWWYHVAPLVVAKNEETGELESRIVDPALSPTPLKPEEWIQKVATRNVQVELMNPAQYFPYDSVGRQTNFQQNMPHAMQFLEQNRQALDAILGAGSDTTDLVEPAPIAAVSAAMPAPLEAVDEFVA
jgi:hypothetical protein